MQEPILSTTQVKTFHEQGFLVLPQFYGVATEIEPIQRGIHAIIGLVIRSRNLPIRQQPFSSDSFDSGYREVIATDRALGGLIYDAAKQIPAFVRLIGKAEHEGIFRQLRNTDLPGVAAGGSGIRIDNPGEEKYRAPWHQEYPAQLRSLDGLIFWSPLLRITPALGPVEICVGSHKGGLVRVHTRDPANPDKGGAYALILEKEPELLARYPHVAPLTGPGDLILMDWLTLHASGMNRDSRARWAMQLRYFNFNDPTGIRIDWRGSFAAGVSLRDIHPELVID